MPDPSESGFIVVECQKAPNQNNKHVCVPKTWVTCKISEKRVAIAYPTEDESRIATRINNKEPANNRWPFYIGDIKYEAEPYEVAIKGLNSSSLPITNSYEDAVVGFLQTVRGENSKQVEDQNINIDPVAEPNNSLKVRIVLPKPKPKSDKKKKSEKKSLKKHLKEHSKHKNKKTKHKNLQQISLKENIPDSGYITGTTTSPDSVDDHVAPELSSPFVPNSNCQRNGVPKSLESKMDDVIDSAPQNYVKQLTNNLNNNKNKTDLFEKTLESLAHVMEKDIDFTNANFSPKDRQLLMDAQTKTNGIFKFIKDVMQDVRKMYIEAQETKKTLDHIASKYNVQRTPATVTEEKENDSNDPQNGNSLQEEILQDGMESEADDEMENEINAFEQNGKTFIVKEEDLFDEQDTDMDIISDNEMFTDGESTSERATRPPSPDVSKSNKNNNKNNTTWTLKHLHPGKGLVHLGGRNSGVYISAKGLEKAKETSKNVKIFTRHLFREVFTQEALETCSMTGSKRSFGKNIDIVRPPLHNNARTVIFNYAMNYCRDVGWDHVRLSELVQSLRCMLQCNRRDRHRGRLLRS